MPFFRFYFFLGVVFSSAFLLYEVVVFQCLLISVYSRFFSNRAVNTTTAANNTGLISGIFPHLSACNAYIGLSGYIWCERVLRCWSTTDLEICGPRYIFSRLPRSMVVECLFIYLSIYTHIYIYIYIYPSIHLYRSIYISIDLFIYLSIYLSIYIYIHLSIYLSIYI